MRSFLRRTAGFCAIMTLLASVAASQQGTVRGKVIDENRAAFNGAHIRLVSPDDTLRTYVAESAIDGSFHIDHIVPGHYRLEITAVGSRKTTRTITVSDLAFDAGTILLTDRPITVGEVIIEARIPTAEQRGDTTEYLARAFKTNKDATAEDLITKMPGITVVNGSVSAGGESVQRVLVDGKPYFGDDPTLALRNLPAEVIDKIQVFDQMSDQAQFTGFDDGQSVRALNIMTRRERRDMNFGKLTAGYGDEGRYEAGGNYNSFQGDQRLSVLGLSNDINEQNFTSQDLLGVVSGSSQVRSAGQGTVRRGNGGTGQRRQGTTGQAGAGGPNPYAVGQLQGINTTHMFGTNASDSLAGDLFAQGSYFFNRTDNENQQSLDRTYLLGGDSTSLYNQNTDASSRNFNHRLNARVVYTPDDANSFIMTPQVYVQSNRSDNAVAAATVQRTAATESRSTTSALNAGYDLGGHLVFRHKFDLPGRTASLDVGLDNTRKKTDGQLASLTQASGLPPTLNDTADQQSHYLSTGRSITANLVFTEPAGVNSLLQLSYAPSFTQNNAEKSTFDLLPGTQSYLVPDLPLSSVYANTYLTQNAGLGYRIRTTELNMMAGLSYQLSRLRGNQSAVPGADVDRSFATLLPNFMLLYTMPDHRSLRITYRASTRPPGIAQLQHVIDNTNPLLLSTGNPALDESHSHALVTRYSLTAPEHARSMFILFSATMTNHYIANSTVIPAKDTVLPDGTPLAAGTQLSSPVNLNGYWNLRSFLTYGFPFDLLSSSLNLNTGVTFTRTPGLVNALRNLANAWSLSEGFVLGSNISQDFDFTVSYTGNFTLARNTLQADANSNYYSHTAALKWTWTFWEGIVLRNELNNTLTTGQTTGYNQNIILWNISLAKKLFRDELGEVKIGVADLLGQNKNVSRTVTETYLEDTRNEALTRYVMASFTYTFR